MLMVVYGWMLDSVLSLGSVTVFHVKHSVLRLPNLALHNVEKNRCCIGKMGLKRLDLG